MEEFDPYHKWLGIPKKYRPPTYYHLLGIDPEETDRDVIEEAAVQRTTHLRAYQIGPQAALCTRMLNEVSQARTTLLNPAKRQSYDANLAPQVIAVVARPVTTPAAKPRKSARPEETTENEGQSKKLMISLALGMGGGALVLALVITLILAFRRSTPAKFQVADNPAPPQPFVVPEPKSKKPGPSFETPKKQTPIVETPKKLDPMEVPKKQDPVPPQPKVPEPKNPEFVPLTGPPSAQVKALGLDRKPIRLLPGQHVGLAEVMPDGSLFALTENGAVFLDLRSGKELGRLEGARPETSAQNWISEDRRFVLFRENTHRDTVALWDLQEKRQLWSKGFPMQYSPHLDLSADRKLGLCTVRTVFLFDGLTGRELNSWKKMDAHTACFLPDNRFVLIGDGKRNVLWDTKEEKAVREYTSRFGDAHRLVLGPDGKKVYLPGRKHVEELDLDSGTTKQIDARAGGGFALSPSHHLYAAAGEGGKLVVGDLRIGKALKEHRTKINAMHVSFAFDANVVVAAGTSGIWAFAWQAEVPEPEQQLLKVNVAGPGKVRVLPNSQELLLADPRGLHVVNAKTGVRVRSLWDQNPVTIYNLSPDGRQVALVINDEKRFQVVELATGRHLGQSKVGRGFLRTLTFSPDSKFLASTEDLTEFKKEREPVVQLWDAGTRSPITHTEIGDNHVYASAAFSADGSRLYLASYPGHQIRTFEAATLKPLDARKIHLPSGFYLSRHYPWAIVPQNFRLKLFPLEGAVAPNVPDLHIWTADISADGKLIAYGSGGTLHIAELPSFRELAAYEAHDATIHSVSIAPNNQFVATTSPDGTLRTWPVPREATSP